MGVATATVTITDKWWDGQRQHLVGTIAISAAADTYATGGLVINLFGSNLPTNNVPTTMQIFGTNGPTYAYAAGTDASNGKIKVFVEATVSTNTTLTEHTAAAVASTVSGDTINFHGIFKLR